MVTDQHEHRKGVVKEALLREGKDNIDKYYLRGSEKYSHIDNKIETDKVRKNCNAGRDRQTGETYIDIKRHTTTDREQERERYVHL